MLTPHRGPDARRERGLTRREFCAALSAGATLLAGCGVTGASGSAGEARLTARPGTPTGSVTPGLIRLGTGDVHDGYLYVPASYQPATPRPLVLGLHGAGRNASDPIALLTPYADAQSFLFVVVNSSDYTWDGVIDEYGADVRYINTALQRAFDRVRVDAARVILQGFSDGASYALGLGVANGDLFTRLVAHSPGFLRESDSPRRGLPEIFISHGRSDPVLNIDSTSRQLVPALQAAGYPVTYEEFDGGHSVPPAIAQAAVDWMLR